MGSEVDHTWLDPDQPSTSGLLQPKPNKRKRRASFVVVQRMVIDHEEVELIAAPSAADDLKENAGPARELSAPAADRSADFVTPRETPEKRTPDRDAVVDSGVHDLERSQRSSADGPTHASAAAQPSTADSWTMARANTTETATMAQASSAQSTAQTNGTETSTMAQTKTTETSTVANGSDTSTMAQANTATMTQTHTTETSTMAHANTAETSTMAHASTADSATMVDEPADRPTPGGSPSPAAEAGAAHLRHQLNALESWLEEAEDLMESQRPPAADPRVLRAQLQSHDLHIKLVDDKQDSVFKFLRNVEQLPPTENETDLNALRTAAEEVNARYMALVNGVHFRRQHLSDALGLAEEFQALAAPLKTWVEETGKKVGQLCRVVTTPAEIERSLRRQERVQAEIDAKRDRFDALVALYAELGKLVGAEEENELDALVRNLTTHYDELGQRAQHCGAALRHFSADMCHFLADSDELADWLDQVEAEFARLQRLPLHADRLLALSEEFAELARAVNERQASVSRIVEESQELCAHTSGAEAMQMSARIDRLHARYDQLLAESVRQIDVFADAIRLSNELADMVDQAEEFLDDCDDAFYVLDDCTADQQVETLLALEKMLAANAALVEEVEKVSLELRALTKGGEEEVELVRRADELRERFAAVRALIDERLRRLQTADQQQRDAFDALDFWLDFFADALQRSTQPDRPPADLDQLRDLAHQQRVLNQRVAAERVAARETVAEAQRLNRGGLSLGAENAQVEAKVERLRRLVEEAAEAGAERLALLEQTHELCKELVPAYEEINDELARLEAQFDTCTEIHTGMSQEELRQQQMHNNHMLQSLQDERRSLARFERNIDALADLCHAQDAANLRKLCDELLARLQEVGEEFGSRGAALDRMLDRQGSLPDRLDAFARSLQAALALLQGAEAAAARPPVLRRQLEESARQHQLWHAREPHLHALRDAALQQLDPDQPPQAQEAGRKLAAVDALWLELQAALAGRDAYLRETLPLADAFWQAAAGCQQLFKKQRADLAQCNEAGLYSSTLDLRNQFVLHVQQGLQQAELHFAQVHTYAADLRARVADEERAFVDQQLLALGAEWQWLQQASGDRQDRMGTAQDMSQQFYHQAEALRRWLNAAEPRMQQVAELVPQSPDDLQAAIQSVSALRNEANQNKVHLSELTQCARDLCAFAQPQQGQKIADQISQLDTRFNRLYAQLAEHQRRFERGLLHQGRFDQLHDQLAGWMADSERALHALVMDEEDAKKIELELTKMAVLQKDIASHVPTFDELERSATSLIQSEPAALMTVKPKLDKLLARFHKLNAQAQAKQDALEQWRAEASTRRTRLDKWRMWLEDVAQQAGLAQPPGALPETVEQQQAALVHLLEQVEQRAAPLAQDLEAARQQRPPHPDHQAHVDQLQADWTGLRHKLDQRRAQLADALRDARALETRLNALGRWAHLAEKGLNKQPALPRQPQQLHDALQKQNALLAEIGAKKEEVQQLTNSAMEVQLKLDKRDGIYVKNQVVTLKNKVEKILQHAAERAKSMETALMESESYLGDVHAFLDWVQLAQRRLADEPVEAGTAATVREQCARHERLLEELRQRQPAFDVIRGAGQVLMERAAKDEKRLFAQQNQHLQEQWAALHAQAAQRTKELDEALALSGQFEEGADQLLAWLEQRTAPLQLELDAGLFHGDMETLDQLMVEARALHTDKTNKQKPFDIVHQRAEELLKDGEAGEQADKIREKLRELDQKWAQLEEAIVEKGPLMTGSLQESRLNHALEEGVDLTESARELKDQLERLEARVRRETSVTTDEEADAARALHQLGQLRQELEADAAANYNKVLGVVASVRPKAHPRAREPVARLADQLGERWDQLQHLLDERHQLAQHQHDQLQQHSRDLADLHQCTEEARARLDHAQRQAEQADQPDALGQLIADHERLRQELRDAQPRLERVLEFGRRAAPEKPDQPKKAAAPYARTSGIKRMLSEKRGRSERERRTAALGEQWERLWAGAEALETALRERRAHLAEVERLRDFSFGAWRDRYLAWTDATKARHSDLFRQIDKRGAGQVTRAEFVDGVLRTRFPTTRLEMERVADQFDKQGMVSSREFANALRYVDHKRPRMPMPLGGRPAAAPAPVGLKKNPTQMKVEKEKIAKEIDREVKQCKCRDHFKICADHETKGGAVKYAFGESSMKRMVRILHSTVMVRVGGGWEELSSFLRTHDPCRAKGRTNIELNHGHEFVIPATVTPAGASDVMGTFGSRKSSTANNNNVGGASGRATPRRQPTKSEVEELERLNPGPVIKVREKTERSVPMFRRPYTPNTSASSSRSYSRQASDLSAKDGSATRIPRPASFQNLAQLSRPSSRASTASSDQNQTPTRLPLPQRSSRPPSRNL